MKAVKSLCGSLMMVLLLTSPLLALTFDFFDAHVQNKSITTTDGGRYTGFAAVLDFPDSINGTYNPSPFEYDDVVEHVTRFEITLAGYGDDSEEAIDVFFNLGSSWVKVAAYNVDENCSFTLTVDLIDEELQYTRYWSNGTVRSTATATIQNISMYDFVGKDTFQVAYGCHFWHSSTSVYLEGSIPDTVPVPEPLSVILLLAGIAKLIHWSNKR